jgi:NADPH:quinone reductase-like Zn-dependent oxidoreductase/acyl carrier protein
MPQVGVLDHLRWRAFTPAPPAPGQVTVQVEAAGLNFVDVLSALGARPDRTDGPTQLGAECAGRIIAVGEGVTDLHPGDRVVAIAARSFGTVVNASTRLAVQLPDGLSMEQAAALPIAFVTAYYALCRAGRLRQGERVLIHAAAGGTGLAAVAVARWVGAEVWATAGSAEKRQFLHDLGIEHVYDSRTTAFAGDVLAATGGRGVDVVLNTLSGEGLAKGLETLAPYGRFLDISKKDIHQDAGIGLGPFRRNLSYTAIDLARMVDEQPGLVREVLSEVLRLVAGGQLAPLPVTVFPAAEVIDAFRLMAQAQHIGKIVVSFEQAAQTPILPAVSEPKLLVRADRTYLITGGLGGLGLKVAEWLKAEGARHLALVGRSAPDPQAAQAVAQLEGGGVKVVVLQADVTAAQQLSQALDHIRRALPALGGVVHAAGLLDDGLLLNQTPDRLRRVLAPKLAGAWNLHTLTRSDRLDFFILFSSAAALLGSPGQANYAAANAFLDALAHHRRAQGLPALSINWGPFAEVGLVARAESGQRLALRGVGSLTPAQGLGLLRRLLGGGAAQVGVVAINARQWRESNPRAAGLAYFAQLEDESTPPAGAQSSGGAIRSDLTTATGRDRLALLQAHVCEQVGQVMRLPAERVNAATPFQTMGMDSLMALELRNRLEASLGLTLPATLTWAHPNAAALATHLADLLQLPGDEAEAPARPAEPARTSALERVNVLSEDEVDRLLAEKMSRKRQPE